MTPPQPLPEGPQATPSSAHVLPVHDPPVGAPHTLGTPPPPQVWPAGQVPQLAVSPPQPSPCTPHLPGNAAQVSGVHDGALTHEVRSKSMNSSSFSCVVIAPVAPPGHSLGYSKFV